MAKTISFQSPTDYTAEQQAIDRQRALGQMLMQQGVANDKGAGETQSVDGWAIRKSPWEHLSNMANKAVGVYAGVAADQRTKELGEALRDRTSEDVKKYIDIARGTEASDYVDPATQYGGQEGDRVTGGIAGTKGDKLAAALFASNSPSPVLQQIGAQSLAPYTLGKDAMRVDPLGGNVSNRGPTEYANAVHYETSPLDGKIHAYMYAKDGSSKKDMGPANPQNQFTTPTADAQNSLAWKQYAFSRLSAAEQAKFNLEGQRLGQTGAEVWFNTGQNVPRGTGWMPNVQNQFTPPFSGAPSIPGAPAAAPTPPSAAPAAAPRPAMPPQQLPPPAAPRPAAPAAPSVPGGPPGPANPMVPASMQNNIVTPKDRAHLAMQQPQQMQHMQAVTTSLDRAINTVDRLAVHPGLNNITGPVGGRTWNLTENATGAQTQFDSLKAQVSGEVLQAMRDASKTGGAVGQVTEKEWPRLEGMLGALSQSTSYEEFKKNLLDVRAELQRMYGSTATGYRSTYGDHGLPKLTSKDVPEWASSVSGGRVQRRVVDW